MVEKETTRKITPPYATPSGLRLFFEKIKRVKPLQLTSKWMDDNELPFGDAIVTTMKFLSAVDKDGNLLPTFAPLRLEGKQSEDALASLVTRAYKPIFDQVEDIAAATESDLNNAFKTAYDVGAPGRYVRPFLVLCELSRLREPQAAGEDKPRTVRRQAQSPTARTSTAGTTRRPRRSSEGQRGGGGGGDNDRVPVQVVVRLDIPWEAPVEEVRERIRAISNFASTEES